MKRFLIVALFLFTPLSSEGFSELDPWNTYQWNKWNVLSGSNTEDRGGWFEWWYYKIVLPEQNESLFFVYGIVNPWDRDQKSMASRSYVSVGDFKTRTQVEAVYPVTDFNASYMTTKVQIAKNFATDRKIAGDVLDAYGNTYQWNVDVQKNWAFNAEGWMMGTGLTDIEWYPAQASATCSGSVVRNGETIVFQDAPCYQDRNWGRKFPEMWTWIVSNQFEKHPDTVLAVGGGKPHILSRRSPVTGISIGLRHNGLVYDFRPIDFDKMGSDIQFGKWEVWAEDKNHRIEVSAWAPKESFMDLQFITPEGVVFHDYETLNGKVSVRLFKKTSHGHKLIADLKSNFAGIEYGSN